MGAAHGYAVAREVEQQQVLGLIRCPVQHLPDRSAGRLRRDGDAAFLRESAEPGVGQNSRQIPQISRDLRHVRQLIIVI